MPELPKKFVLYCTTWDHTNGNPLKFEMTGSCICCWLVMLMHKTERQTNTAEFSWAWLNITNSYLGIIATLPVLPQPSPCRSTPLSPLSSALVSRPKRGSKNSGELNSHNNMRLSGDRGSNVCAGQHEGRAWRLLKTKAMRMTAGISFSLVFISPLPHFGGCRMVHSGLTKKSLKTQSLKKPSLWVKASQIVVGCKLCKSKQRVKYQQTEIKHLQAMISSKFLKTASSIFAENKSNIDDRRTHKWLPSMANTHLIVWLFLSEVGLNAAPGF